MENWLAGVCEAGWWWEPWSHILKHPWQHATLCEVGACPSPAVPCLRCGSYPGRHGARKMFPHFPRALGALQGPELGGASVGLALAGALHQRSQLVKAEN